MPSLAAAIEVEKKRLHVGELDAVQGLQLAAEVGDERGLVFKDHVLVRLSLQLSDEGSLQLSLALVALAPRPLHGGRGANCGATAGGHNVKGDIGGQLVYHSTLCRWHGIALAHLVGVLSPRLINLDVLEVLLSHVYGFFSSNVSNLSR